MKSNIVFSLYKYITDNYHNPNTQKAQFRIPAKSYCPNIVYQLLEDLSKCYTSVSNSSITIKIAKQVFDYWKIKYPDESNIYKNNIENLYPEWIDNYGNLTVYRNDVSFNQNKSLLILVGDDLIDDQSSLSHFLDCGIESLWNDILKQKFDLWIERTADEFGYSQSKEEIDNCNKLLHLLIRYSDLNNVDKLLCSMEENNCNLLSQAIGYLFPKAGIQYLDTKNKTAISKCFNIISKAKSFTDGNMALDNNNQILRRIDNLIEEIIEDDDLSDKKHKVFREFQKYQSFSSLEEYLNVCKKIVTNTKSPEEYKKFMETDAGLFVLHVLGYKTKKEATTKVKQLDGLPLNAVLHALWMSLNFYYKKLDDNSKISISSISLKPISFEHNIPKSETDSGNPNDTILAIFDSYIVPVFGGIDEVVCKTLSSLYSSLLNEFGEESKIISNSFSSCLSSDSGLYEGIIHSRPTKIPSLTFEVKVVDINNGIDVSNQYKISLPQSSPMCYSRELLNSQNKYNYDHPNCFIPIFTLGKYDEYFSMNDEESDDFFSEIIRDPVKGINVKEISITDANSNSTIEMELDKLHHAYISYVDTYISKGAYYSISSNFGSDFYRAYNELLLLLSSNEDLNYSCQTLKIKLLKAFWIIDAKYSSPDDIASTTNMYSACLSLLHPSMVEMVSANIDFLSKQFVEVLGLSIIQEGEICKESEWSRIEDFSNIQAPLPCILTGKMVKTQVKGSEMLFKIGYPMLDSKDKTPLSVILDKKNEIDLEDLSDSDLSRITDESTLIHNLLKEYIESYGFASDSIKIAIFMPVNIQAIMSAIIQLIKKTVFLQDKTGVKKYPVYPFKMEIEFYSDPDDEGRIGLWITKLNQYLFQKKLTDDEFAYADIAVGYRMIHTSGNDSEAMIKVIESDFDADICILYEAHNSSIWNKDTNRSAILEEIGKIDETKIKIKFPMIEKLYPMRPISDDIRKSSTRTKLVSNRQFKTYESYLNLMFSVEKGTNVKKDSAVVITEQFNFEKWLSLLNWCLSHSERVIALGSEIDKDLIIHADKNNNSEKNTTIVGFGSGVGANANLNYIVASRLFNYKEFNNKLSKVFSGTFKSIPEDKSKLIVEQLESDSSKMADLSLVRTLSCYDFYSHDYFGYSMIRHILVPEKDVFCDVVLSLDSYRHWFSDETRYRADLLWVQANLEKENGVNLIKLKLTVIESKLAGNVEINHISKAYRQIKQTVKRLSTLFDTKVRHDSRYWWMQLHRIIASNSVIDQSLENKTHDIMEAMEHLAEGYYKIDFDQYIVAFETNVSSANCDIKYMDANDGELLVPTMIIYAGKIIELMTKKTQIPFSDFCSKLKKSPCFDISISDAEFKESIKKELAERYSIINGQANEEDMDEENIENDEDDMSYFVQEQRSTFIEENNADTIMPVPLVAEHPLESNSESSIKTNSIIAIKNEFSPNKNEINGKIPIGKTKQGEIIYWTYALDKKSNLINRHMLILGASGTGKSYAIKTIMGELARQSISTLIIDYTDGFTEEGLSGIEKYTKPQYIIKAGKRLPINPFIKFEQAFDSSYDVATRVADVFQRMYQDMGDNQKSILIDVIEEGIDTYGLEYSMQKLLDDLENKSQEKGLKNNVLTLKQKIKPFCKVNPFDSASGRESAWNDIFFDEVSKEKISVFQLIHIAQDIKLMITDFVLWDLWYYMTSFGPKEDIPHMVVLDEVQNLHIHDKKAPIFKYLTEGRKFGFGVIAASQGLTGLGGIKSEGLDALLNAGTLLVFKPKPQEMSVFAKSLSEIDSSRSKEEWIYALGKLEKGECIYYSNDKSFGGKAKLIKIMSLEERGLN